MPRAPGCPPQDLIFAADSLCSASAVLSRECRLPGVLFWFIGALLELRQN